MTEQQLTQRAREHWMKWLPAKTAALREAGEFLEATQAAGKLAAARVAELMAMGYQQHEAAEVALAEHVLLKPEPEAVNLPWERTELRQMERAHHKRMSA